jgi:hypothetical protein
MISLLSDAAMRESERALARQFARTDDGWFFTTSGLGVGPRSFRAPERNYRVDDRQKAELLARLVRRRSALQLPGILVMLAMFAAFGLAFWFFRHSDGSGGIISLLAAAAVAVLYGEVIAPAILRQAIRPVLAQATPTAVDSVRHDVSRASWIPPAIVGFAWPWLVLLCLLSGSAAIYELTRIGQGFDPIEEALLLVFTIMWAAVLYLNIKGSRS